MAKLGDGEEKYVEDSVDFICDGDKLSDLSAVIEHGCLTVAQCALIFPAYYLKGKKNKQDTLGTYLRLMLNDIGAGKLNPKHPDSLLPYSAYLKMSASGMYGEYGERMPLPTADWLITLEDAEKWLTSHGIQINFDGMRREREKVLSGQAALDALDDTVPSSKETHHNGISIQNGWEDKAQAIAQEIGLERHMQGEREITARNLSNATAERLSKDTSTHGRRGPRSSDNVRNVGLRGWKFIPPKDKK